MLENFKLNYKGGNLTITFYGRKKIKLNYMGGKFYNHILYAENFSIIVYSREIFNQIYGGLKKFVFCKVFFNEYSAENKNPLNFFLPHQKTKVFIFCKAFFTQYHAEKLGQY